MPIFLSRRDFLKLTGTVSAGALLAACNLPAAQKHYWQLVKSVLGASVVAYWPLNESSGSIAYDISGNGRNGVYSPGFTMGQKGIGDGNTAVTFNGTTGYVNLYSSSLASAFNGNEGTLIVWVKNSASGWGTTGPIIAYLSSDDSNNRIYLSIPSPCTLRTSRIAGGTGVYKDSPISGPYYKCVAFTWSYSNNRQQIYMDGLPIGPLQTGLGSFSGPLSPYLAVLGHRRTGDISGWDGSIGPCAIADREATAAEIFQLGNLYKKRLNAATYLQTPTYDGSGQGMHPDVYDAGAGKTWNGHRYWMAFTPYPFTHEKYENPSILVSQDGNKWSVPTGLTNPVVPYPGQPAWNADACLCMSSDGTTLWMVYNVQDTSSCKFYALSSTNGTTWSVPTLIYSADANATLSPSVIWDGSQYVLYFNYFIYPYPIKYITCTTMTGTWSAAVPITHNLPTSTAPKHLQVTKSSSDYRMLIMDIDGFAPGLYSMTSIDGLSWSYDEKFELKAVPPGAWDAVIYRACSAWNGTHYDIWYSAMGAAEVWHIGRTSYTP